MIKNKKIVCLFGKNASIRYFANLIIQLQKKENTDPILVVDRKYYQDLFNYGLNKFYIFDFIKNQKIFITNEKNQFFLKKKNIKYKENFHSKIKKIFPNFLIKILLIIIWKINVKKFFYDEKINYVYAWSDMWGGLQNEILIRANLEKVKIYHIPVSSSHQEIIADLRLKNNSFYFSENSISIRSIIRIFFPNQYIKHKVFWVSYFSTYDIFIMFILNSLPTKPWVLGSRSSKVFLPSDAEKKYWISKGCDQNKISKVDYFEFSFLKHNIQNFNLKTKTIGLAIPPMVEHGYCNEELFYRLIYNDLKLFKKLNFKILLTLHPKVNKLEFKKKFFTFRNYFKITSTLNVIINSDAYCGYGSSTILWAESLNIKSFDLMFRFNTFIKMFSFSNIIFQPKNQSDFERYIKKIIYKKKELPSFQKSLLIEKLLNEKNNNTK